MRYFLGIDGGASKTHALISDEIGHVIGFGSAGGSNHQTNGLENSADEIEKAILSARSAAGVSADMLDFGCFCLAGADFPEDFQRLKKVISDIALVRSFVIMNDTFAALRSGLSRSYGVTVICGTGFNAAGIAQDGHEIVLPGLGAISVDWGVGIDISLAMIQAIMRAWDGRGGKTVLTNLVLDALRIGSVEILLHRIYNQAINQKDFLALTPLVFKAARGNDAAAIGIVRKAGVEAGTTVRALIRRLNLGTSQCEVVLSGSIFKGEGTLLIDTIRSTIYEEFKLAEIKRPLYEPVVGALLLALDNQKDEPPSLISDNLKGSLPPSLFI